MGLREKDKKLSNIFATNIIIFCISVLLSIGIIVAIMLIGFKSKYIRAANYYEKEVLNNIKNIADSSLSDVSSYIPENCIYVVYGEEYEVLDTNIDSKDLNEFIEGIKQERYRCKGYYFKLIDRSDNTYCVVGYTLIPTYTLEILNKFIPNPSILFIIVIIITFIMNVVLFSKRLSKCLKKEFKLLKECSQKINMDNLDFTIDKSSIVEINDILAALDKMKNSLNKSLEQQWTLEANKRNQINALAHDIKTPLTIIKGNAELMEETQLNEEQEYFNKGIMNESNNIEKYLKFLLDMINFDNKVNVNLTFVEFDKILNSIWDSASSLASIKNIELIKEIKKKQEYIKCDFDNLVRVMINIISNAFDFCSDPGKVIIKVDMDEENIIFTVYDNGRGFSKECIIHGTEQFYQEDKSRNSKNHYGMGLYICKKIVSLHKGSIILSNSKSLGGGKVTVKIPKD